jgi:cobalt/nickel transport system permease protein
MIVRSGARSEPLGEQSFISDSHRHGSGDFIECLLRGLLTAMEHAADAERIASGGGLLQGMDPRTKILGLLSLIVAAVFVKSLLALAALFGFAILLGLASGVGVVRLARQAGVGVLLFTGVLAAPALFLVPGDPAAHLPLLDWAITWQGLRSAAFLIGRAETAATFALLVILTTPWSHVLKALRMLGVPPVLIAILGMTYRYIFVLLGSAVEMFEAQRSRLLASMSGAARRRLAAASAVVLLEKALRLSSEVHLAMVARGYRGEVCLLDEFRARPADWLALAGLLLVAVGTLSIQWLPALSPS